MPFKSRHEWYERSEVVMSWKVLRTRDVFKAGFFKLREEKCELPDGRVNPRYYVLEFLDWVNVVPVTKDGQIVLVEQYRHGAGQTFLEVPGGSTNGRKEDPLVAGQRELREETGYGTETWIYAGYHFPNPALQDNRMHTYLALDCEVRGPQELDPFEDLAVKTLGVADVFAKLDEGGFHHSLIAASLALVRPHLRQRGLITT